MTNEKPTQISEEQLLIYNHVKEGKNVIVDAIAGSGKSTTIIHIAQLLPDKQFLHVTYNSMLRKEFKQKIVSLKLENIEVHTYHSLAVKYFIPTAFTDTGIREILNTGILPAIDLPPFNIVVLDECQDMTRLYYNFIRMFISLISNIKERPLHPPPQLLFLGDYMQCLYEFKGADWRFLTLAREIWSSLPHYPPESFIHCSLKTSYRITNQMSAFVNNAMLGEKRMNACREGSHVVYIRNNRYNLERIIIHHIKRILDEGDLPSDIFILAPSVKGTFSNVRRLENVLVDSGIPCHVPMFENERIIDEKVINGKIVFSTFHSVKGRQRKYVFVMNFDNSYFTYNARNLPTTICPNTLYVATTRATHKLYLLEINQRVTDRPIDFLKLSHSQMNQTDYIDFKGTPQTVFYEESKNIKEGANEDKTPIRRVTPTDLIKFLPESVIEAVTPLLKKIIVKVTPPAPAPAPAPAEIDVPSVVSLKNGLYEDVSDLNGVAIPAIYCDYIQNKTGVDTNNTPNILWRFIENIRKQFKEGEYLYLKRVFESLSPFCRTPAEYLYMSNVYIAFQEKLYFKLKQIDVYEWLTEKMITQTNERMDRIICDPDNTEDEIERFEDTFIHYSQDDKHVVIDEMLQPHIQTSEKYRFTARLDLITTQRVWELKFVNELTIDHYLQFVIYAWLWKCVYRDDAEEENTHKEFYIFNIRKEEIFRISASFEELTEIVVLIIKGKYEPTATQSDDEFVNSVRLSQSPTHVNKNSLMLKI